MKKTKFMTRIIAVVFALAILFAMSVPAWAAENTYSGAYHVANNPTPASITGNSIPLTKSIVFVNNENKQAYEPNITYTFTITPVTVAATTTVNDGTHPEVKVNDGVLSTTKGDIFTSTTATIAFSSTNTIVGATSTGYELERPTTFTIDPTHFEHAGIYRYKISESSDVTPESVGITRGNTYSTDRYLDVYIRNNEAGTALEMYGAVMFKTTGTSANNNEGKDAITTSTEKTTGFEPATEPSSGQTIDYTSDTSVDIYTTYNVTVTKTVTGSLGDKTHQFPFSFTIDNSIANAKYSYVKGNGTAVAETVATDGTSTVNSTYAPATLSLANGESFVIYGVPSNQTNDVNVLVSEKNTTPDTYTVSIAEGNNNLTPAAADLNADAIGTTNAVTVIKAAMKTIAFTNDLSEISPTGLAFRVAPYVLMLAAGVSLIVLFAKRRREVTDMI